MLLPLLRRREETSTVAGCRPVMCVGAPAPAHSSPKITAKPFRSSRQQWSWHHHRPPPHLLCLRWWFPLLLGYLTHSGYIFMNSQEEKHKLRIIWEIFLLEFSLFLLSGSRKIFHSIVYNFAQAWLGRTRGRQALFGCAWPRQERRTILSANAPGNHEIKQNS